MQRGAAQRLHAPGLHCHASGFIEVLCEPAKTKGVKLEVPAELKAARAKDAIRQEPPGWIEFRSFKAHATDMQPADVPSINLPSSALIDMISKRDSAHCRGRNLRSADGNNYTCMSTHVFPRSTRCIQLVYTMSDSHHQEQHQPCRLGIASTAC